jgi:hypothetical protein
MLVSIHEYPILTDQGFAKATRRSTSFYVFMHPLYDTDKKQGRNEREAAGVGVGGWHNLSLKVGFWRVRRVHVARAPALYY